MTAPRPAEIERRASDPPLPTSMKNGAPKTIVRRAVQARPNSSPASELAPVDEAEGARRPVATSATASRSASRMAAPGDGASSPAAPGSGGVGIRVRLGSARRRDRRPGRARRPPGAAAARPRGRGTTSCRAAAAYQKTVPKPKKIVTARRTGRLTGSRPRAHQQRPTSIAPRTTETARSSVASPNSATTGMRTMAGSGGNGRSPKPVRLPLASRSGKTSWKKSLPGSPGRR